MKKFFEIGDALPSKQKEKSENWVGRGNGKKRVKIGLEEKTKPSNGDLCFCVLMQWSHLS